VATGTPQYVVALDPDRNTVIVGDNDALLKSTLTCRLAWIEPSVHGGDATGDGSLRRAANGDEPLKAKIRYRHEGTVVSTIDVDGDCATIGFAEPQRAISPGQTVALYRGDVVVGSGIIES
jgi:tRNA-specific 2-thiouridylase